MRESRLHYFRTEAPPAVVPAEGIGARNAWLLVVFCCLVMGLFSYSTVLFIGSLRG